MYRSCFLFILLFHFYAIAFGQNNLKMNQWQDSLVVLGTKMYQQQAEPERIESNFSFVKTLVSSLKEPNSFFFTFDRLKMISVLSSPDQSFRIFSWNIPLQDGSYLYYGAIQHKSGTLKLTPLLDKTFEIPNPSEADVTANTWYGAQYYDIIPLAKNQYILLGWKGHHADFSQKVIDILTLDKAGNARFGGSIFGDDPKLKRKIFSYTKEATMYLKYNVEAKRLEFDHLVPAAPHLMGNYKYYGPDLSYDGYKIVDGRLEFQSDIAVYNPARGNDSYYIDPKKPTSKQKSGLNL